MSAVREDGRRRARDGDGATTDGAAPGRARDVRVALVTYSTKPRGGVVHTLHLAEALHDAGAAVRVFTLGPAGGTFFRPTRVPHSVVPGPAPAGTLEQRVFRAVDALADGLAAALPGAFDVVHVQDCIAARAATRVRDEVARLPVLRTVHHLDDFTTPALVDCQHRSVLDADHVLTVSEVWRRELARLYGIDAAVVHNGVDVARFAAPPRVDPAVLRRRVGASDRFLFLAVGGIEPRKGSYELMEALGRVRAAVAPPPVLAVVGGHSFQDHSAYRERALARAEQLGMTLGRDVVVLGTVADEELRGWYHAADALVFPSVKEGWGLVVLEAMAAGLPVVASDIPVFREYLADRESALLPAAGDAGALADAMRRLVTDGALRGRLAATGGRVARRFTWPATAARHLGLYRRVAAASPEPSRR